ncbi:MAG TPA: MBOAT family O-acyltransferase [Anaeromyxobacter sp.]|nr:MBOAT family O-acyltransferase [Anaeromyxobacter sp.]
MPFTSYEYLLAFLPLAALVFHGVARVAGPRRANAALLVLSLAFYARSSPAHLLVLVPLVAVNFGAVSALCALGERRPRVATGVLAGAIALDLGVLAAFKYAGFAASTANALLGLELPLPGLALPLGISFFTFAMIGSLVAAAGGGIERADPLEYALFASLFPYVAAGPIVRHDEVVPQLRGGARATGAMAATGVTLLAIGLAKKVLLAGLVAPYADARFGAAAAGQALAPADAWAGALAYAGQIYFDFSGYSDMAIGAALLLGIRLPVNFASPYRATSAVEFWQRWHVTLSRLVRDLVFTPLALRAARRGRARPYRHLLVAMLLVGLWHGAGWTYVAWGGLHGVFLAVNHGWRALAARWRLAGRGGAAGRVAAGLLTLAAVVAAWVLFRAPDLATAGRVLAAMAGAGGAAGRAAFADTAAALAAAAALLLVARVAPNSQQLVGYAGPGDAPPDARPLLPLAWAPSPRWGIAIGLLAAASLVALTRVSEFIYFKF